MLQNELGNIPNIELRVHAARQETARGLVIVVDGVEGVGKTTTCTTLHERLRRCGMSSVLLVDQYERTGRTGPGIAALTEDPGVLIETDLTLFLLYCARFSDKAHLAWRLAVHHDVVLVDRFDLSLRVRAKVAWSLPQTKIDSTLSWAMEILRATHIVSVCLDATETVRGQRVQEKPIRRRNLLPPTVLASIHDALRNEAKERAIPIIDTSVKSPAEVVQELDSCISLI